MPRRGIKKEDKKAEWSQKLSGQKLVKSKAMMLIPLRSCWWKGKEKKRKTHAYNS